jgi:hypothetical protein
MVNNKDKGFKREILVLLIFLMAEILRKGLALKLYLSLSSIITATAGHLKTA